MLIHLILTRYPASADRRPVDPPPIVELKIYEGEGNDEDLRDVTFAMNANYFLFATLEQARNVAHGRVQQDQNRLTVLTGTPVAGMVYLDRPTPAGYFIFPDLSVRHEGKYRLSFSLYEELKDEKDYDQHEEPPKPNEDGIPHVTHRLEVKSNPFTVYSAKKFPGLTESTSLSRMVAEQGCRVRIRRDVRMRRRDQKSSVKDWDGYEDETADVRARMSATPEASGYAQHGYEPIPRPRSGSNVSHHSLAPSLSLSRRPSLQDLHQGYHQSGYNTAPHTPQSCYPQSSPYGPSPSQSYSQPPFMHQQSAMQPPPAQYSQQQYQAPPPLSPAAPPPQHSYTGYATAGPPPPVPQSLFAPPMSSYEAPSQAQRISVDYSAQAGSEYRRPSAQYAPPPPPPQQPSYATQATQHLHQNQSVPQSNYQHPPAQPGYSSHHPHQSSYGSLAGPSSRPAPLEPIQPPTRPTGATTPLSGRSFNDRLPGIDTSLGLLSNRSLEPSSPASSVPQSAYYNSSFPGSETHKRSFGQVYNDRYSNHSLKQGARPGTPGYGHPGIPGMNTSADDADLESEGESKTLMSYRRADGRYSCRNLPAHS